MRRVRACGELSAQGGDLFRGNRPVVFFVGVAVGLALFHAGRAGASVCFPQGYGWVPVRLETLERGGSPIAVDAQDLWPAATLLKLPGEDRRVLLRIDGTDMVLSP